MPRKAREKHNLAIYHIICRSISEILLFREDEDKDFYLYLLKKCSDKYKCSVYAYCLMNNHLHIHLNPKGYDISSFMHSINTSYVLYYNKKYKRHGHVFQERFHSRILDSERYNLTVSAYIHNNPKDIEGYAGREKDYKYSSYGIYLGLRKNVHSLIDMKFVKGIFGSCNKQGFAKQYYCFVTKRKDVNDLGELRNELAEPIKNEYISGRRTIIRGAFPANVITYILKKLKLPNDETIIAQNRQKIREFRAFTAYVLRVLCGLSYKQICNNIYNITISGCSKLCDRGFELICKSDLTYRKLFNELAITTKF